MSSLLCAVEEFSTLSRGFRENASLRKHYVKQEARLRLIVANLVFVSCIVVFLGLLETSSDLFRAMTMSACCAFAAFMFHSNTCAINNKKEDCISSKEPKGKRKKGASCGCATNFMLMMDLRKKIMAFRDIIDLPLCSNYVTIDELVIRTIEDLQKSFPEDITTTIQTSEMKGASTDEVMISFYEALSSLQKSWMSNYKRTEILKNDMEDLNLEQIVEAVLTIIDHIIKVATERFDMMYDDNERMFQIPRAYNTFGKNYMDPCTEMNSPVLGSPVTPTSVLDFMEVGDNARSKSRTSIVSSSASIPLPLRVRGIKKLSPVDVRCLSFNMMSHVGSNSRSPVEQMIRKHEDSDPKDMPESTKEVTHVEISRDCNKERLEEIKDDEIENEKDKEVVTKELPETEVQLYAVPNLSQSSSDLQPIVVSVVPQPSSSPSPPPPPPKSTLPQPSLKSTTSLPPLPSPIKNDNATPTLPPPPPIKSGSGPPAPNLLAVGGSPPPPPPGAGRSLRAKKASSKLKRSTQLGNLYRILKGKIEGPSLKSKSFNGRKGIGSSSADAKQGMADALAEMTKRSSYFQQIEEDVQNYAQTINELKMKIKVFQTSDMKELIRFHKQVESNLEKLTDETQVLARFEGFPSKKLEALRTAAFLYLKLDAVYNDLKSWKIEPPLGQLLDKVERYFTKVKKELDAFERTKDEEAKKFRSHNITFDFQILTRIKESMVDVSSSCMELALKERREAKDVEAGDKSKQGGPKMLWRAFQFAFRVYTFAGGLDDRADELTKELAQEIERAPPN